MSRIYLDTASFVIAFETSGRTGNPVRCLFDWLQPRPYTALTSELTIAEFLAPTKTDRAMSVIDRRELYLRLLDEGRFIELLHVTRQILLGTIALREQHPRRIPDAIHISTALRAECRYFISFDRDARRLPEPLKWMKPTDSELTRLIESLDG